MGGGGYQLLLSGDSKHKNKIIKTKQTTKQTTKN